MRRTAGGPFRPFAIPDALHVWVQLLQKLSPCLLSTRLQSWSKSWKLFGGFSAVRSESLERLDWESGRWDDLSAPLPHPKTYNIHTQRIHLLSCSKKRKRRFREGWRVCVIKAECRFLIYLQWVWLVRHSFCLTRKAGSISIIDYPYMHFLFWSLLILWFI